MPERLRRARLRNEGRRRVRQRLSVLCMMEIWAQGAKTRHDLGQAASEAALQTDVLPSSSVFEAVRLICQGLRGGEGSFRHGLSSLAKKLGRCGHSRPGHSNDTAGAGSGRVIPASAVPWLRPLPCPHRPQHLHRRQCIELQPQRPGTGAQLPGPHPMFQDPPSHCNGPGCDGSVWLSSRFRNRCRRLGGPLPSSASSLQNTAAGHAPGQSPGRRTGSQLSVNWRCFSEQDGCPRSPPRFCPGLV